MLDKDQILRYSRQLILREIGASGQEKLLNSKVLVIGAGGLGSPVLSYLAGSGVGTIGVSDFDTVGISNLNRQILYTTDDIGRKKVDMAGERLKAVNPDVKVIKYPYRINIDNIEELISEYDLVIDATDNFPARYLVSDCCFFMKKPLIEGAAVGFIGTVMTVIPGESPCYRCLYPVPPQDGIIPSCADTGIIGMVTGVIGSLQALEAVKVLLGIGNTLAGKVLFFNGFESKFEEIELKRSESCPLCGPDPRIRELVQYEIKCRNKAVDERAEPVKKSL